MSSKAEVTLNAIHELQKAMASYKQSLQYTSKMFPVDVIVFWVQHVDKLIARCDALATKIKRQDRVSPNESKEMDELMGLGRYIVRSSTRELTELTHPT